MRTWIPWGVLVALGLAGCGENAAVSPLPANSMATLYQDKGGTVTIESTEKDAVGLALFVALPSGTRVRVLEDQPAKPPTKAEQRLIRVRVEDGERKGLTGTIRRNKLRPAQ
jgi:hypothetical protein